MELVANNWQPWVYFEMVLASMRFPDLSLGPYKRDLTTKPFAELRSFVMVESPSLRRVFASCIMVANIRVLPTMASKTEVTFLILGGVEAPAGLVRFTNGPFCGYQHDAWNGEKQSTWC